MTGTHTGRDPRMGGTIGDPYPDPQGLVPYLLDPFTPNESGWTRAEVP